MSLCLTTRILIFWHKRQIVKGDENADLISTQDVLSIISRVKSSVSEEERKRYEALKSFESIL